MFQAPVSTKTGIAATILLADARMSARQSATLITSLSTDTTSATREAVHTSWWGQSYRLTTSEWSQPTCLAEVLEWLVPRLLTYTLEKISEFNWSRVSILQLIITPWKTTKITRSTVEESIPMESFSSSHSTLDWKLFMMAVGRIWNMSLSFKTSK